MLALQGNLRAKPEYDFVFNKTWPLPDFAADSIVSGKAFKHSEFEVKIDSRRLGVSWWVSPKRTRTYPYSRIYSTLGREGITPVTIIPLVKDEGLSGDRDYVQWDSISLATYVGVYAVLAFYIDAEKNYEFDNKVTNLKFDHNYVLSKLRQVAQTELSPQKWNERERSNIGLIADFAERGYEGIERKTGVQFHDLKRMKQKLATLSEPEYFKTHSRILSKRAQCAEGSTRHRREHLEGEKVTLLLTDPYGGQFSWTVDEAWLLDSGCLLIEKKNSRGKAKFPDVTEGLFRMLLYTNMESLRDDSGRQFKPLAALGVTGENSYGACFSHCVHRESCDLMDCVLPSLTQYNGIPRTIQVEEDLRTACLEAQKNGFLLYCYGLRNAREAYKEILQDYLKLTV